MIERTRGITEDRLSADGRLRVGEDQVHRRPVMKGLLADNTRRLSRTLLWGLVLGLTFSVGVGSVRGENPKPRTADEILKEIERIAALPQYDGQVEQVDALWAEFDEAIAKESAEADTGKQAGPTPKPKSSAKPRHTPKPKATPRPTPTPSKSRVSGKEKGRTKPDRKQADTKRKPPRSRRGASSDKAAGSPAGTDESVALQAKINEDAENYLKPFFLREYNFSIDGTYADLIEAFARMSGLGVLGEAPKGDIKFVSDDTMDFKSALGRVQTLLFSHPEKYWLFFKDNQYLQIVRVTAGTRILDVDHVYPNLLKYQEANLDENELALLIYTPEEGSIGDLEPIRDFMPDYVRIAPLSTEQNAMTVFGLAKDINKYLELIRKFQITAELPFKIEVLKIEHVLPSDALAALEELVAGFDMGAGAASSKRKAGQPSAAMAQAQGITAIADDLRKTILVRAVPKKIEEIKKFLVYIDVPLPGVDYTPEVVRVQHVSASEVIDLVTALMGAMEADDEASAGRKAPAKRPSRRGKKAAEKTTAASGSVDDLSLLEWEPANAIILIGSDEQVERAKVLIARFDVPSEQQTKIVETVNGDPEDLVSLVTEVLESAGEGGALVCTVDPSGSSIILSGPLNEVSRAEELIAQLDVAVPEEPVHSYKLTYARPSALLTILNAWEAATPAPPRRTKGKPRPRKGAKAAGSTFHADDASGILYAICTDEEWINKYQPMIEKLDSEMKDEEGYEFVAIEHIDPAEVVKSLQGVYGKPRGSKKDSVPTFVAVPNGVLIVNANPDELLDMKNIIARVDVDPETAGGVTLEKFELAYADAADVVAVVDAVVNDPAAKGRKAQQKIRFVEKGSTIYAMAPAREMSRIASLISELDIPLADTEIRSYEFGPGVNVVEFAVTLQDFFPDTGRLSGTPQKQRTKPRTRKSPRRGAVAEADVEILFVPQPASRKLFVSAPVDLFEEIEQTIELLRPDVDDRPGMGYEFIPVHKADPDTIVQFIEPIMQQRYDELVAIGQVPEPTDKKKSPLLIVADSSADRIVYAGPKDLIPEIHKLVEDFEQGDYGGGVVVEKIMLKNAHADDVVAALKAMIAGQVATPARNKGKKRARAKGRQPAATAQTSEGITVVASGSDAVIISGDKNDLPEIKSWIALLDEEGARDSVMKVYKPVKADVSELSEVIKTVLDSGGGGKQRPQAPKDDMFSMDDWDMGGPWRGTDISLNVDYMTNTMIVWASPRKIQEIDELVELYEVGDVEKKPDLPKMMYDLKYADAFDAMYDLEEFISALWTTDAPTVDYIPFKNTLIVRSKNPDDDFPEIEKLLAKYIDKESEVGGISIRRTPVKGATADSVAGMLVEELQRRGVEVEIESTGNLAKGGRLRELSPNDVNPCVLPACTLRMVSDLAATCCGQLIATEEQQPKAADAKQEEQAAKPDELTEPEPKSSTDDLIAQMLKEKEDAEKNKSKVRIVVDPRTNSISFEGSSKDVADAEYVLDQIMDDFAESPQLPDIRVWELKHVQPSVAAQVLESMFNASSPNSRSAQQRAAQAAKLRQQLQQQLKQQQQQQGKQGEEDEGKDDKRSRRDTKGEKETTSAPTAMSGIKVFPYPALNAIIVKAPTEMFPALEDLVATIDRPTDPTNEFRFFKIKNQLASDVEAQLETIFGLDRQATAAQTRRTGRRTRNTNDQAAAAVAEAMRQQLNLAIAGEEGGSLSATESITISSNNVTNTVLVLAPKRILTLTEKIIAELEQQVPAPRIVESIPLKYADVTEIVPHLESLFGAPSGRSSRSRAQRNRTGDSQPSGFRPDDVDAVFLEDTLNNAVVVRAVEEDIARIKEVIATLDVQTGSGDKVLSVEVVNGDAVKMAKTLDSIYGMAKSGSGRKQGTKRVQFVGDSESNTIFVSAPEELREEISARIADMDAAAGATFQPKFIDLTTASATKVAKIVEQAFGVDKRRGNSRIKVTGDDTTKRLMVICPDDVFPQVQKLANDLDKPSDIDIKTFQLKHARAPEVLKQLEQMVGKLMRQIRDKNVTLDPFSASADERSNTLVVMGSPVTFALVGRVLTEIDVPTAAPISVDTMVIALNKARANEVANSVKQLFRGRRDGIDPPEAVANNSSNTLLVRGTQAQLDEIREKIIKPLDEFAEAPDKMLKEAVIPLQFIQAEEAAEYLKTWFTDRKRAFDSLQIKGLRPDEFTVAITPEPGSNQLVVLATEENQERIRQRVADIDKKDAAGAMKARVTRIYNIKYADPNGVNNIIRNAFKTPRKAAEKDRVDAAVEWATQTVVVTASEANQEAVASLITDLDKEGGSGQRIRKIYPMKAARASKVANLVNNTLGQTRKRSRTGQMPVSVVADDELNVLVVTATEKEYNDILPLIEGLDQEPSERGLEIRVYQIKYADPGSMIGAIHNSFPRMYGSAPEDMVKASYTWGTSSLIVSASEKNHEKVAKLIQEIDVESSVDRTTRVIALKEANAEDLARRLNDIMRRTQRRRRDDQGMAIVGDPGTNSLLVFANEPEFERVKKLVETLDVPPTFDKEIRSFKLVFADVHATSQAITQLFGRSRGRSLSPREEVAVVAEWASNSVVVSAAPSKMKEIENFVKEIDQNVAGGRQVQVIRIDNADPQGVVRSLNEIFVRSSRGRRGQETITISCPQGSDSILIKANEKEYQEIAEVIEALDVLPDEGERAVRMFTLKYTDASEMQTIVEDYLRMPGTSSRRRGRGSDELIGKIRLSTIPSTNSLVATGASEGLDRVAQLVAEIDVEVEDAGNAPRIIQLEKSLASEIEPTLTKMFVEGASRNRGRGRGSSASTITPVIIANDASNSLIVRAGPADFSLIEKLARSLDLEEKDPLSRVKLIQIASTYRAEDIAATVEETLRNSMPPSSSGSGRRGRASTDISVEAITTSNSLLIAGEPKLLEVAEALIEQIQKMGPAGGRKSIIVDVKNMSAEEIKGVIEEMIDDNKSQGSTRRRPRTRRR